MDTAVITAAWTDCATVGKGFTAQAQHREHRTQNTESTEHREHRTQNIPIIIKLASYGRKAPYVTRHVETCQGSQLLRRHTFPTYRGGFERTTRPGCLGTTSQNDKGPGGERGEGCRGRGRGERQLRARRSPRAAALRRRPSCAVDVSRALRSRNVRYASSLT
ncbi:unnamed protein product [Danaus chrysippus]|uniref:(African queen) hypothetical protein n=1 Tax=Danaus chrysippus TaxID=151541 RepID=A0A8J2QWC7_9NEOP|nr:unnamed protein product [Danaus chrysippus]